MAKKWYVVHTYSGFENKVKKSLEERVRQHELEDHFGEVQGLTSWAWLEPVPFLGRQIAAVNDVATIEALRLPAQQVGVRWTQAALEQAIELTKGYPHEVQLLGEAAWNAARPESGGTISVGHVRQGQEIAERRMDQLFAARMAKTTAEQRRFLAAMASLGDGPITRRNIADTLGVTTEALSRPRQELIDRGLIEPAGHGQLRYTVPGFASYLRSRQRLDES